jgi:hypothetical protein
MHAYNQPKISPSIGNKIYLHVWWWTKANWCTIVLFDDVLDYKLYSLSLVDSPIYKLHVKLFVHDGPIVRKCGLEIISYANYKLGLALMPQF